MLFHIAIRRTVHSTVYHVLLPCASHAFDMNVGAVLVRYDCRLTNQVVSWFLVALSVYVLVDSSVLSHPFQFCEDFAGRRMVLLVVAANVGRYVFRTAHTVFVRRSLPQCGKTLPVCISHAATLASLSLVLVWQENLLLGLVGILMEPSSAVFSLLRTLSMVGVPDRGGCYQGVLALGIGASVVCRLLVPLALIGCGMSQQSPLAMSSGSLAVFCGAICFFGAMSVWHLVMSCCALRRSLAGDRWAEQDTLGDNNTKTGRFPQQAVATDLILGLPNAPIYKQGMVKPSVPSTDKAGQQCRCKTGKSASLHVIQNNLQMHSDSVNYQKPKVSNLSPGSGEATAAGKIRPKPVTNPNLDVNGKAKGLAYKNLKKMGLVGHRLETIAEDNQEP